MARVEGQQVGHRQRGQPGFSHLDIAAGRHEIQLRAAPF